MSWWIRRNWLLIPFIGIATIMLLKGIDITSLSMAKVANFFNWDFWATTSFGEYLEETFGTRSAVWLWLLVPLLVGLVIWKLSIGGFAKGIVDIVDSFIALVWTIAIYGGGVILALLVVVSFASCTGALDKVDSIISGEKRGLPTDCLDTDDLDQLTHNVSTEAKCLRIRPNGKAFSLFVKNGRYDENNQYLQNVYKLKISLAQSTIDSNPELFKDRDVNDFLLLGPRAGMSGQLFQANKKGFNESGARSVNIMVQSVPK